MLIDMRTAVIVGLVLAATQSTAAQLSLPRPPGVYITNVSNPEARGNEPGIAINTRNPAQIVGVYQGPARAVYSSDFGRTFATAEGTVPPDWRTAGDVSVAFDNKGNAYLSYLTFDKLGSARHLRPTLAGRRKDVGERACRRSCVEDRQRARPAVRGHAAHLR
jgi:hypothetical protein